ncbi:putative mitochondrial protein like [Capsicum chacoense]
MYLLLMLALIDALLAILISFSPLVPTFPLRCNILVNILRHPQVPHMLAGIHVLRYIMDDPAQGILLSNSQDFSLLAYSDLDWAACAHTQKSVTGFFISLGGSPISWKSKKQPTISLSSTEAKYRELRMVVAEISWLTRLLGDLGLPMSGPILVYCDNQAALHIAKNLVFHERTKHIVIDCDFVRDCLIYGLIYLYFVSSEGKSLYSAAHRGLMSKMGVHSPSSLRGWLSMIKFKPSCLLYRIRPRPNSSTRLRYISFFLFLIVDIRVETLLET